MNFSKPKVTLLIGACGSGKTNAVKHIILKNAIKNKIFQFGLVFSKTGKFNNDYKYVPEEYVYQGFNENVLKSYLKMLQDQTRKTGKPPANFIVLDDLLSLLNNRSGFFANFLATHRHYNTSIFLCAQQLKLGASTTLREIVNYVVAFNSKRFDTQEALFKEFSTLFKSFRDFQMHFQKVTSKPFHGMFYDNSINDLQNNYKTITFPDMSNIKISLSY